MKKGDFHAKFEREVYSKFGIYYMNGLKRIKTCRAGTSPSAALGFPRIRYNWMTTVHYRHDIVEEFAVRYTPLDTFRHIRDNHPDMIDSLIYMVMDGGIMETINIRLGCIVFFGRLTPEFVPGTWDTYIYPKQYISIEMSHDSILRSGYSSYAI